MAVFAGILLTGDFLPPQLIYQGTTQQCLLNVEFPNGWHVTCTASHWPNEDTMMIKSYSHTLKEKGKNYIFHPALVTRQFYRSKYQTSIDAFGKQLY